MNLEALIAQFRVDADDKEVAYFWSDESVTGWLNEAEEEAAIRANLLYDTTTADVCQIATTANTATYPLHPAITEIGYAQFVPTSDATRVAILTQKDRLELDRVNPRWRQDTGEPRYFVQDDTTLTLHPRPSEDGALTLEAFRLPLEPMVVESDEPEISQAHHRHLVDWALFRAFSLPHAETMDPKRAGDAEERFTAHFGHRVDADMRRAYRTNVAHTNKAHW